MSGEAILFLIFALATCLGAIAVVVSQNVVRMAFWLMVSLGSVAGLFFLLRADFVAATQLLIYVGGTVVLLVFGVMLTASGRFAKIQTTPAEGFLGAGIGSLFLAMLFSTVAAVNWPDMASHIDPEFGLAMRLSSASEFERHDPDGNDRVERQDLPKNLQETFDRVQRRVHGERLSRQQIEDVRLLHDRRVTPRSQPVVARKPPHAVPHSSGPVLRAVVDESGFDRLDGNNDGWLTRTEIDKQLQPSFEAVLRDLGVRRHEFESLLVGSGYNRNSQGNTARPIGLALLGPRTDRDLGKQKGGKLSTGYLLPFEIISIHLLVVLIGAAYLARAKRRVDATNKE
jgi:NADH:ubiquinone oxidoreductase subunit 6 (subunit J)